MNKYIKQQLEKVKKVKIPPYNEDTTEIIIKRYSPIILQEGGYYLIKLDESLLNPNFNTVLINNWNAGKLPTNLYYKVEVIKIMGQMVKVNGLAFDPTANEDLNSSFNGWLFINKIEPVKKI